MYFKCCKCKCAPTARRWHCYILNCEINQKCLGISMLCCSTPIWMLFVLFFVSVFTMLLFYNITGKDQWMHQQKFVCMILGFCSWLSPKGTFYWAEQLNPYLLSNAVSMHTSMWFDVLLFLAMCLMLSLLRKKNVAVLCCFWESVWGWHGKEKHKGLNHLNILVYVKGD